MEIVGEHGFVTLDPFQQVMSVCAQGHQSSCWAYWGSNANQSMTAEFAAASQSHCRWGSAAAPLHQDAFQAREKVRR